MRFSRLGALCATIALVAACSGEDISNPDTPPLAGVRFINALADTSAVDVRMVDQVEWTAYANALNFRQGIEHMPTEAKARHIRVFSFASRDVGVVQQVLADTTITFTANSKYTLLLTGSARAKTVKFVVINDDATDPGAGLIAVRTVNASTGAINSYVVTAPADPLPGTPSAANVGAYAASPYLTRPMGAVAVRVTDPGSTTANASVAGPASGADPVGTGYFKSAGIDRAGSAFSVYYFPRGVAGSPQTVATPSIVWFVDRIPTT